MSRAKFSLAASKPRAICLGGKSGENWFDNAYQIVYEISNCRFRKAKRENGVKPLRDRRCNRGRPLFRPLRVCCAREGKGEDEPGARRPAGESVLDDSTPTTGLALCAMGFDWLIPLVVGAGPENYASGLKTEPRNSLVEFRDFFCLRHRLPNAF